MLPDPEPKILANEYTCPGVVSFCKHGGAEHSPQMVSVCLEKANATSIFWSNNQSVSQGRYEWTQSAAVELALWFAALLGSDSLVKFYKLLFKSELKEDLFWSLLTSTYREAVLWPVCIWCGSLMYSSRIEHSSSLWKMGKCLELECNPASIRKGIQGSWKILMKS